MSENRDPARLFAADLCKKPGCGKRRLGPSEFCPNHLNEKLEAEREARERARKGGAGNWAGWDLPPLAPKGPGGLVGRIIEAAASRPDPAKPPAAAEADSGPAAPPAAKAPPFSRAAPPEVDALASVRAEVASKLARGLGTLGLGALFPGASAEAIVERLERASSWLSPERQADAWLAVRALIDRGAKDIEAWRGALGRLGALDPPAGAAFPAPPAGPDAAPPRQRPETAPARDREVEDRIGKAMGEGLAAAASLLGTKIAEGSRVALDALGRASREGGPLDRRSIAALLEAIERRAGEAARAARRGALAAVLRPRLLQGSIAERVAGVGQRILDSAARGLAFLRRRIEGRYETDPYGRDEDIVRLLRPLLRFLYRSYFRVEASGLEHIPARGPGLIVANHGTWLPYDAAMVALAVAEEGPRREVRMLVPDWLAGLPFAAEIVEKLGMVIARKENGERLLLEGRLVGAFPEGAEAAAKTCGERGRLAPFDDAFIRMALRARAPVIPCAVAGAESSFPAFVRAERAARLFGLPSFPITPLFPWLGPLGLIPLPGRWRLRFGPAISLEPYGPEHAEDAALVARLANEVRNAVSELFGEMAPV